MPPFRDDARRDRLAPRKSDIPTLSYRSLPPIESEIESPTTARGNRGGSASRSSRVNRFGPRSRAPLQRPSKALVSRCLGGHGLRPSDGNISILHPSDKIGRTAQNVWSLPPVSSFMRHHHFGRSKNVFFSKCVERKLRPWLAQQISSGHRDLQPIISAALIIVHETRRPWSSQEWFFFDVR
jgi:hypothetical protein